MSDLGSPRAAVWSCRGFGGAEQHGRLAQPWDTGAPPRHPPNSRHPPPSSPCPRRPSHPVPSHPIHSFPPAPPRGRGRCHRRRGPRGRGDGAAAGRELAPSAATERMEPRAPSPRCSPPPWPPGSCHDGGTEDSPKLFRMPCVFPSHRAHRGLPGGPRAGSAACRSPALLPRRPAPAPNEGFFAMTNPLLRFTLYFFQRWGSSQPRQRVPLVPKEIRPSVVPGSPGVGITGGSGSPSCSAGSRFSCGRELG